MERAGGTQSIHENQATVKVISKRLLSEANIPSGPDCARRAEPVFDYLTPLLRWNSRGDIPVRRLKKPEK